MLEVPPFECLETPRLRLRRLHPEDAPALAQYRSLPEVARFQGWNSPYPEPKAMDLIDQMQNREPGQSGWFQFAVALGSEGTLIGDIGVHTFEERQAELGFTLSSQWWGKGYATEALEAVINYAFKTLQMHRLVAATDTRNLASQKVLERLGFRKEGHLIEAYFDGTHWLDECRYGLLAREWFEAHRTDL